MHPLKWLRMGVYSERVWSSNNTTRVAIPLWYDMMCVFVRVCVCVRVCSWVGVDVCGLSVTNSDVVSWTTVFLFFWLSHSLPLTRSLYLKQVITIQLLRWLHSEKVNIQCKSYLMVHRMIADDGGRWKAAAHAVMLATEPYRQCCYGMGGGDGHSSYSTKLTSFLFLSRISKQQSKHPNSSTKRAKSK